MLDDGYNDGEFPSSPKAFYKEQYCEALDLIIFPINESLDIRSTSNWRIYITEKCSKEGFEECLTTVTILIIIKILKQWTGLASVPGPPSFLAIYLRLTFDTSVKSGGRAGYVM